MATKKPKMRALPRMARVHQLDKPMFICQIDEFGRGRCVVVAAPRIPRRRP